MNIEQYIASLLQSKPYTDSLIARQELPEVEAVFADFPAQLDSHLVEVLHSLGYAHLYKHQADAVSHILAGRHTVISTGVASGKSLCYQIPIMQTLALNPAAKALLFFPTKALAQDQHQKMAHLLTMFARQQGKQKPLYTGIYDGDTPSAQRQLIRKQANLVFTNPDMLHLGILPHHTMWSNFFSNLRYIIIDEVHIYRGVFGSHVANVIRRLLRLARFYRSEPVFVCTSATLANAREFIQTLIENPVELIDTDCSPHGKRSFHIVNPPMLDPDLGIRKSSMVQSVQMARDFLKTGAQALLFTISRRSAEMLYIYLTDKMTDKSQVHSYRSGYLPEQRRAIEKQLRDGAVNIVITTNALELGIDIGGLDAVFLNGYPGTIAATRQQAGRAGRKGKSSFAALIAASTALDQYICSHPEYIFDRSPEQALIDPDNPEILLAHLLCAVFEMAFTTAEGFGSLSSAQVFPYLQMLVQDGKIRFNGSRYSGQMETYPANEVSLRNMGGMFLIRHGGELVGVVDEESVMWMAHPEAIYLHRGDTWLVKNLDLANKRIDLEPVNSNYYTLANRKTEIELTELLRNEAVSGGEKSLGKVKVTSTITGFKKLRWVTQEVVGYEDLDLPSSILNTVGMWLTLSPEVVKRIQDMGLWRNKANDYGKEWIALKDAVRARDGHSCQHCGAVETDIAFDVHHRVPFRKFEDPITANHPDNLITLCARCHRLAEQQVHIQSGLAATGYLLLNIAPFFLMCDEKDIGIHTEDDSPLGSGSPVIIIYDRVPGGIGLSKKLYDINQTILSEAYKLVSDCPCKEGCPSCTGPVAENGMGAKEHAMAIIKELIHIDINVARVIDFPLGKQ